MGNALFGLREGVRDTRKLRQRKCVGEGTRRALARLVSDDGTEEISLLPTLHESRVKAVVTVLSRPKALLFDQRPLIIRLQEFRDLIAVFRR